MTEPLDPDAIRDLVLGLAARMGLAQEGDAEIIADLVRRASAVDGPFEERDVVGLIQAYGRAVDRIAVAEVQVGVRWLAGVPPERLEEELRAWLDAVGPLAGDAFAALHERRLEQMVRRRVAALEEPGVEADDEVVELSVALVDLRRSTAFMLEHDPAAITALLNELYFTLGEVASRNEVHPGKYLGDGVLLISRDGERLVRAVRQAVAELGARTPLRAGAGVARGPVIRHAGDWFGTPVNLAARLAELADADQVVVDEIALPDGVRASAWREVVPRGLAHARRVAVLDA